MKLGRYTLAALGVFVIAGLLVSPHVFAVGVGGLCYTKADQVLSHKCDTGLVCQPDENAQKEDGVSDGYCVAELGEGPQTVGAVLSIVKTITNWVFALFIAISIIYIIWGAYGFVTGGGDPQKIQDAKQRLLYAAIGIALALLANSVPAVLRDIIT